MDSLCTLPLSSMESVSHSILGTVGSSVYLDCFTWIALVDSLLCPYTWPVEFVSGVLFAVSGTCVLSVQILFKVVEYVVKVCGCWILGKLTTPIAFACVLPNMIGPVMLVTLDTVGNAL